MSCVAADRGPAYPGRMPARALLLALVVALACTRASEPTSPSNMSSTPSEPAPARPADVAPAEPAAPRPEAAPAAAPAQDPQLVGYPLVRLRSDRNPVAPLDFPLPAADLQARGVKSYRAFAASAPQLWLLVFEFETQAAALAQDPETLVAEDGPPYHRKTSHTGNWLLLTGFPGDKPVSPAMEFARAEFIGSFAGEE